MLQLWTVSMRLPVTRRCRQGLTSCYRREPEGEVCASRPCPILDRQRSDIIVVKKCISTVNAFRTFGSETSLQTCSKSHDVICLRALLIELKLLVHLALCGRGRIICFEPAHARMQR